MIEERVGVFVIRNENEVLLTKKECILNKRTWQIFTWKLKRDESHVDRAIIGLDNVLGAVFEKNDIKYRGKVKFEFEDAPDFMLHVYITEASKLKEIEKTRKWFHWSKLPFDEMWPDVNFWMGFVITGMAINATFEYNEGKIVNAPVDAFNPKEL